MEENILVKFIKPSGEAFDRPKTIFVSLPADLESDRGLVLHTFTNESQIKPALEQATEQFMLAIEEWMTFSSGYIFDGVVKIYLNIAGYQPMRGSSHMPLPE